MLTSGPALSPMDIAMGGRSLLTPRTGIGQYVQHLVRGMMAQGHSIRLFCGTHWASAQALQDQQQAAVTPARPHQRLRSLARNLARNLAREHAPWLARFAPALEQTRFTAGVRGARRPQIYHEPNFIPLRNPGPTVITVHDVSWVRFPQYHPAARLSLLQAHFPRALERADRVIVVSEFVRRELLDCFAVAPQKIRVVLNGVSEQFTPKDSTQTHATLARHGLTHGHYLVVVGTLEPRKNLITALAAHARLPTAMQHAYPLVLAGVEGWLNDKLHAALRQPVSAGTVKLLGYVPDADLPTITAGACALLYPSIYEGFGLPPLEAMACGVPVLASRAGAVQEVVGDAGLLNDALDVDAFAQSMQCLIEDGTLRRRLAAAGLARARQLSWHRAVDETLAVYRGMLA